MQSKKSSRDQRKTQVSRKPESESNDIEDLSSQSFAEDSNPSYKSFKKKHASNSSSSKRIKRTDDDTEDYFSDVNHPSRLAKKKKIKSGSRESVEEILSDDIYGDKEEDIFYHKSRKQKSKNKNGSHSHESIGEKDLSKKDSAKSKKKRRHAENKPLELPITEILKKAQENRTKYEDPVPLPELTSDTIYVQGRNGFSAMKISGNGKHLRRTSGAVTNSSLNTKPIRVAIVFQKIWHSIGLIFQGLLGGIALLHLILMETYFDNSEEFINNYSALSEIYTSVFSFCIAVCLIATFDKFDLGHIGGEHFRNIYKYQFKSILVIPLYIAAFSLHQVTSKVDDKLALLHYNSSNMTYYFINDFNDTRNISGIEVDELKTWQRMTFSKNALVVLGWIFISIGNPEDMLLIHLQAMNKYSQNSNPTIAFNN